MPREDVPGISCYLYGQTFELPFGHFYRIWMIPTEGSMVEPRPSEFEKFSQEVTVRETRGVSRDKSASLHFPVVCYFALFVGKCLTTRQEGGTLSAPDLPIT